MKKSIIAIIEAAVLFGNISIPVFAKEEVKLYIDIDFEENIIFNKYNVDLYVDDEKIDTLQHGEAYTKLLELDEGEEYTLNFYKEDDSSVNAEQQIKLNSDMTFSCKIVSHSDEIDVKNIEIEDGISGAHLEMIDLTHVGLSDAYSKLEEIGFINVNSEDQKGKRVSASNSYIVLSQNVDQGEILDKNDKIILECQKTSEYIDENFLNLNTDEAKKVAEALGYGITFYQNITGKNMDSQIAEFDSEEIVNWIVVSTELDNNIVELGLAYQGNKECPNVVGLSLADAEDLLEENDFPNYDYEVITNDWVWDKDNWQVLSQSVAPGEVVDVNTKVDMIVQSYESIKEEGILLEDSPLNTGSDIQNSEVIEASTETLMETEEKMTEALAVQEEIFNIDLTAKETIIAVQDALNKAGYNCGTADGIPGQNTKNAITEYKKANDLGEDGEISVELIKSLGIDISSLSSISGFSQENAKRAAVVAMTNGQAIDVFTDDGNEYDPLKFHSFDDMNSFYMDIYSEGDWVQESDGSWSVSGLILHISGTDTYLKANMTVAYDGNRYTVYNVKKIMAALEYLDSNDLSKINEEYLEPSDFNSFLYVQPSLIENDRMESVTDNEENIPSESLSSGITEDDSEKIQHNSWVENLFSWWDGSQDDLEDLIKKCLNDEKSYKHIDTKYIDCWSEENLDIVNETLASLGYSQRAEKGDVLIICEFSAKNVFNATIKNMAYGLASYKDQTISLITIE